jgi:hypothetical protein
MTPAIDAGADASCRESAVVVSEVNVILSLSKDLMSAERRSFDRLRMT